MAAAEGHATIAGQYVDLWADEVLPPSGHFFGRPSRWHDHDGKVPLLGCGSCGDVGCWPLLCSIGV